jgi:hypothetical protein
MNQWLALHPFLNTQPDLVSELEHLNNEMQSQPTAEDLSLYHPDNALFNLYGFYATQNPSYRASIDEFYYQSGIYPHLALSYPDAAREISLMQSNTLPPSILLPQTNNTGHMMVSKRVLWWLQTYGSDGSRLQCYQQCISTAQKLISRFRATVYYTNMSSLQRRYHQLIPFILNRSPFQLLSNALVDAYATHCTLTSSSTLVDGLSNNVTAPETNATPSLPGNHDTIPNEVDTNSDKRVTNSQLSDLSDTRLVPPGRYAYNAYVDHFRPTQNEDNAFHDSPHFRPTQNEDNAFHDSPIAFGDHSNTVPDPPEEHLETHTSTLRDGTTLPMSQEKHSHESRKKPAKLSSYNKKKKN